MELPESPGRRDQGLRFVGRMWLPRTIGLALGAICIGSVLWTRGDTPAWQWIALALSTLAWPHAAWWLARRADQPYRAELRNLTMDSALGGAWIALMGFNFVPSAVLLSMLSMDKLAVGSFRFLLRCSLAMVLACGAAVLAFGLDWRPDSGPAHIAGSLPLLLAYPMMVGLANHRLARQVREHNQLLAEMSRTDALTRLVNRGAWEAAVSAEMQRCRRRAREAALMMIDIDHFKAINDRHGHPAGDEVIRAVAAILRNTLREQDTPGRYGGEEFGVLLPETGEEGARVLAERLRALVASSMLERGLRIRGTVSIGIAEFRPGLEDPAQWISRADQALYAAKRNGRDRVEVFAGENSPSGAAAQAPHAR